MASDVDSDGFRQLWPTLFLQRELPGSVDANTLLTALILQQDDEKSSLTTSYREQDFFSQDHPAVDWLKTCINKTVVDYLVKQGINYDVKWSIQGWANINRTGDYHSLHNHPHSYLSGTYYVKAPLQAYTKNGLTDTNTVTLNPQRSDLNPGDISFFDPRAQANTLAIAGDAQIEAEHRITPTAGMLLLWPSFLHHFVHPNFATEERISVSFNIVLSWNDNFIPGQT